MLRVRGDVLRGRGDVLRGRGDVLRGRGDLVRGWGKDEMLRAGAGIVAVGEEDTSVFVF